MIKHDLRVLALLMKANAENMIDAQMPDGNWLMDASEKIAGWADELPE